MSKLRNNRGTASTKSNATNVFKALTLIFTFGLCIFSPKSAFAATENSEYTTSVHYQACYDSDDQPTGEQMRTETWRNRNGDIVYEENRNCDGKISSTGTKPRIGVGNMPIDISDMGNDQLYYNMSALTTEHIQGVKVKIIDFTGSPVQSLTVSEDAIIDASSLSDGLPYAVVSTTVENGTIDVKTIMKYGGNIFISTQQNK